VFCGLAGQRSVGIGPLSLSDAKVFGHYIPLALQRLFFRAAAVQPWKARQGTSKCCSFSPAMRRPDGDCQSMSIKVWMGRWISCAGRLGGGAW
jgi:hypothetical protein